MNSPPVILLALFTVLEAEDSCEQVTDYLCGDVCIDSSDLCHCGNGTLQLQSQVYASDIDYYCCVPPGDDRQQCYQDDEDAGHCEAGQILWLGEKCFGECFNSYQKFRSGRLGQRSQYQCEDGQCVFAEELCREGYAVCEDKSDLKECSEHLDCVQMGEGHTKTRLRSPYDHHECQYELFENDGVYDNIGRGDERSLARQVQSSSLNYTELEPCSDLWDETGLMCGSECVPVHSWCRDDRVSSCVTLTAHHSTNDGTLCGNTTFWADVSCDVHWEGGEILAYGKRCSGNSQHCYYPWYTRNVQELNFYIKQWQWDNEYNFFYKIFYVPTCQDQSDRIFDLNTKCNTSPSYQPAPACRWVSAS